MVPRAQELDVLLLTPTGRDAEIICDLLESKGQFCRVLEGFPELLASLGTDGNAGAVIVADEAIGKGDADRLAGFLANQPNWSDLPVLILTRTSENPSRLSSLTGYRGVEVLRRPVQPATLSMAIIGAVGNRRRQYEVRGLLEELRNRASQLRRLSGQLAETEERERRRLAEFVHDDLQQILVGMNLHFDLLSRRIGGEDGVGDGLDTLKELLQEAIAGTRRLSQDLSPTALRQGGLVAALRWLCDHVRELHGLIVDLTAASLPDGLDESIEVFFFRATQELLLNVAKHAETSEARIRLTSEKGVLALEVEDSGKGVQSPEMVDYRNQGTFGLFSIGERAELLGGDIQIDSASNEGFRVRIEVPYQKGLGVNAREADVAGYVPGTLTAVPLEKQDSRRVRVVLVDDHAVLRSGLRKLLEDRPEIDVIDELSGGRDALEAADRLRPDVIVMDVAMPDMDGIEATRRIRTQNPEIRVIGLSMFEDEATAQRMLDAGAERYLTKTGRSEELVSAVLAGRG
jgi:signal transduction histidine kinase